MRVLASLSLLSLLSLGAAFLPAQRPSFGVCKTNGSLLKSAVAETPTDTDESQVTTVNSIRNIAVIAHVDHGTWTQTLS